MEEEKISELEDIAAESFLNEAQRKKRITKKKKNKSKPVNHGTTSSSLIYIHIYMYIIGVPGERRERWGQKYI